ncbi:MAG: hypothetical protein ACSLEN_11180 [Candidatus Malihini olakiniferum]
MISHISTSFLLLAAKTCFTHNLTSAIELAIKTKSPKHIAFEENLLKIKRVAPDTYLESLTRCESYLCCNLKRVVSLFRRFAPQCENPVSPAYTLRREVNQHLEQSYASSLRVYVVKTSMCAISHKVGQKRGMMNVENFTRLTADTYTMIDSGKPLEDITNRIINFKVYHRLNSLS